MLPDALHEGTKWRVWQVHSILHLLWLLASLTLLKDPKINRRIALRNRQADTPAPSFLTDEVKPLSLILQGKLLHKATEGSMLILHSIFEQRSTKSSSHGPQPLPLQAELTCPMATVLKGASWVGRVTVLRVQVLGSGWP